jgi:hypothetical protein
MSRKTRNLLVASVIVMAILMLAASFLFPSADRSTTKPITASPARSPEPPSKVPPQAAEGTRIYAVSVPRLQGLPATVPGGTHLELWVAWEPPITKAPRFQKLIDDVVLDEIVPAPIPEAPPTALLSVKAEHIADLLYADRFGSLAAAIVPES